MADHASPFISPRVLQTLHYLGPFLIAGYYAGALGYSLVTLQEERRSKKAAAKRRLAALWLMLATVVLFVGESALYILRALVQTGWWAPQDTIVYVLLQVMLWGTLGLVLLDTPTPQWHPFVGAWIVACLLDTAVCAVSSVATVGIGSWGFPDAVLAIQSLRIVVLLVLAGTGISILRLADESELDEEQSPLLGRPSSSSAEGSESRQGYSAIPSTEENGNGHAANGNAKKGDSENGDDDDDDDADEEGESKEDKEIKAQQQKRLREEGGWLGYLKGFFIFLPYIWPANNRKYQIYIIILGISTLADRALNVLTPTQLGIIITKLTTNKGVLPWKDICLWILYQVLGSGSIGIGAIRTVLETRISNWSYLQLSSAAFNHVLSLSMRFHDSKDSGEVVKAVEQASSLNSLVQTVLLDLAPVGLDFIIAMGYITYLLDVYAALILLFVCICFAFATQYTSQLASKSRRVLAEKGRDQSRIIYETISNWATVSYFNRRTHEQKRLYDSLASSAQASIHNNDCYTIMYGAQELCEVMGRLMISFLAAYQVSRGYRDIGTFVTIESYWYTITMPLWVVGHSYRNLASNLIDAERLLQLFRTKPEVEDKEGAQPLQVTHGKVSFDNVSFAYDERKTTLKDLNFTAQPGQTIALVGETGSGKSTTLKLLLRFYDVKTGSIQIDGQDLRDVTLDSLRESFGVVAQSTSLFNGTIMDNVRYGRLEATDEEVYEACKSASIHEKILSFPDGYKSTVGERGVKLSGGEMQRVSIARVMLRAPKIVLLDEATSAVDSATEAKIQEAFARLSQGRTTFIIAHRLSTVMDADLILVIDQGEVVERGTHAELLDLGGRYVDLWSKQSGNSAAPSKAPSVAGGNDDLISFENTFLAVPPSAKSGGGGGGGIGGGSGGGSGDVAKGNEGEIDKGGDDDASKP